MASGVAGCLGCPGEAHRKGSAVRRACDCEHNKLSGPQVHQASPLPRGHPVAIWIVHDCPSAVSI